MKVFVIPACHLKPWMFEQADAIMQKDAAEKAVCLMDLPDDFGVHGDALYIETCDAATAFARKYPETLWRYGNHEHDWYKIMTSVKIMEKRLEQQRERVKHLRSMER